MQTRLKPLDIKRNREDYPQINYLDSKGVQWIELNRGCPRGCPFCYADPNYKVFPVPEIKSNFVKIICEGLLYDKKIKEKIKDLGEKKVNNKVVYYGLGSLDYRMMDGELYNLMSKNRIGLINNKGKWYKGIRIAWDWGKEQEKGIHDSIEKFVEVGYIRKKIIVFILTNWKIDIDTCIYKLDKLTEWGVRVDDCTYNTTKKSFIPLHWKERDYRCFRKMCRKHNQLISFGVDPEVK